MKIFFAHFFPGKKKYQIKIQNKMRLLRLQRPDRCWSVKWVLSFQIDCWKCHLDSKRIESNYFDFNSPKDTEMNSIAITIIDGDWIQLIFEEIAVSNNSRLLKIKLGLNSRFSLCVRIKISIHRKIRCEFD